MTVTTRTLVNRTGPPRAMLAMLCVTLMVSSPTVSSFHVPSKHRLSLSPTGSPDHKYLTCRRRPFNDTSYSRSFSLQSRKVYSSPTNEDEDATDSSSLSWLFALVLPLQLAYISNQWSRSSLYYLVNFSDDATPFYAMNADIGFTQTQYGLLASVAFSVLFAIASLGAGAAADRFNRKQLTIAAALGWGTATLGTAFSSNYETVLLCRIVMGLACAFSTPTGYTLINDRVPEERKSFATSLYGTGVALGGALAALSILLDDQLGWKQTTVLIGFAAMASSMIVLAVVPDDSKEKESREMTKPTLKSESVEEKTFLNDISQVLSSNRVRWLFLGTFLRFSAGLSIGVWSASFYKMKFPDNASEYAIAQALITAVAGTTSGLLGGAIADWLAINSKEGEDVVGKKLLIPVLGSVLAAPTFYLAIHAESFETAMTWLAIEYLVAECWFGPTISSMLTTVGNRVGGTGQGLFTLTGALANVAPTAIGWAYGSSEQTSGELSQVLSIGVCVAYLSCATCFIISSQQRAGKQV
jgi:predicted MFS family arabinose efflux permease